MTDGTTKRVIDKVKYDGSRVIIHYRHEQEDRADDEYVLRCGDEPRKSFKDAMDALKNHVQAWLEIEQQGWAVDLSIKGVSFSWSNDIMGAVITAQKPLKNCNSPLIFNTPHKPEEPYSDGNDDEPVIDADCAEALHLLMKEAEAYIDGKRAQMSMFTDEQEHAEAA